MATADYSNWVRELDEYETGDREQYDARHEAPVAETASVKGLSARSGITSGTGRKMKPRGSSAAPISQAEELQQEMKLLNWHKLANEAALKAAIIKTNKIRQEDSQFASALTLEEREERAQRMQQIIEEEQLRPLQVNSEFFRDLEAKGVRDEAKLDNDVQRHIQHLRKLKESMAQREDMQRRRQQYRQKMLELTSTAKVSSRSQPALKGQQSSNQDEEAAGAVKPQNGSKYHRAAMAAGGQAACDNAHVVCSLDKLMELEQRIRHLEDAGLAADDLEMTPNEDSQALRASARQPTATGLRFAKRKASGGLYEPSKTVYTVSGASKMRARDKNSTVGSTASTRRLTRATAATTAKKRSLGANTASTQPRNRGKTSKPDTFITSLPESKQRQLRRMTERERRNFLKNEKARAERERTHKQDVVIDDWLEKKRAAANQRKATSSRAANAQRSRQTRAPAPKVRAPATGAASGKRIANPQLQKLDELKKSFTKRKEALQRGPTRSRAVTGSTSASTSTRSSQRSFARSVAVGASTRTSGSGYQRSAMDRKRGTMLPVHSTMASRGLRGAGMGITGRQGPGQRLGVPGPTARQVSNKLPMIQRNVPSQSSLLGTTRRPGQATGMTGGRMPAGVVLPRLATQTRSAAVPSPPPAMRNAAMPSFSRLHKR